MMRELNLWRRAWMLACATLAATASCAEPAPEQATKPAPSRKDATEQYCANIASAAEAARIARERVAMAEMETQLKERLAALDARRAEVQAGIARLDAFERKAGDLLVSVYTRMKPDAAAAQLSEFEEDAAAALLLKLNPKATSAILNEMDAAHGAAVARQLAKPALIKEAKHP